MSIAGDDHFRLPKQLALYACAIVALAVSAMALILKRADVEVKTVRTPAVLAAAGLAWAILTAVQSTNRALSIDALGWAAAAITVFILAMFFGRSAHTDLVGAAILAPACVNAIVILLQAAEVWNPWVFPSGTPQRFTHNALLGNPDDVGVYLSMPALFGAANALTARGARRAVYAAAAFLSLAGVIASQTLTALVALAIATTLMIVLWNPRRGTAIASAGLLVVTVALVAYGGTRERVVRVADAVQAGDWDTVFSGRVLAFAAAWDMFTDRPLTGVGPGAFKYNYMEYRVRLRDTRPELYSGAKGEVVNFGEVHNDHLQLLAETGLPGWLLMLAGLGVVAARSRGRTPADRSAWTLLAAPLALLLFALMLAQFPFELAAPAFTAALLGGMCIARTTHADPA